MKRSGWIQSLVMGFLCSVGLGPSIAQANDRPAKDDQELTSNSFDKDELYYDFDLKRSPYPFTYMPDYDSRITITIDYLSSSLHDSDTIEGQPPVIHSIFSNSKGYHIVRILNLANGTISVIESQGAWSNTKTLLPPDVELATKENYRHLLIDLKEQVDLVHDMPSAPIESEVSGSQDDLTSGVDYLTKIIQGVP